MCRMLGVICNDEDLLSCAINDVKDALKCEDGEVHDGIGVGYYNQDDPLLSKKPSAKIEEIDYTDLASDVTSRVLLVHIRKATVGAWKEDNTHPFRFRRWLFAHVGHFPALDEKREEVIERLPPFLARNLSGDTDSELAFHMFLDILFREGKLNDLNMDVDELDAYLKECVEDIEKLHDGPHRPKMAVMITNGQVMAAACRGITMHYSHREGILECPLHEDSEQQQHLHGRFRGIMLGAAMSNPGHQWREVADGSRLHISRNLELKVQQL